MRDHTIGQHTIEKHADPHAADRPASGRPANDRPDAVTEPIGPIGPTDSPPTEPIPTGPQPSGYRPANEPPAAEPVPEPLGWLGAARTHLAFALVLLVATAGICWILLYHWRKGSALVGGALELAAVFRALLPDRRAGLLAVRGRPVDVLSYAGLGAVLLFVAGTITGGPFG